MNSNFNEIFNIKKAQYIIENYEDIKLIEHSIKVLGL